MGGVLFQRLVMRKEIVIALLLCAGTIAGGQYISIINGKSRRWGAFIEELEQPR
jgi:hypothetical protein